MVNLKKAALAVLVLGVSGAASAAMYAPPPAPGCPEGNVTVPCEKRGWSFGVDALYVQVGSAGQVATTTTGTVASAGVQSVEIPQYSNNYTSLTPDWNWGFRVDAAYLFGTGNDLNLNWTHFVKTTDQTNTAAAGETLNGLYIADVLDSGEDIDNIDSSVDNKFDAVNLEFGQTVNFGEKVASRFHAGLQYADIRQTISQSGWNGSNVAIYDYSSTESKFAGVGPRAGLDSSYDFGNGVSIFGNFAGGLLVGDVKYNSSQSFTDAEGTGTIVASGTTSATSDTSFVPEAEAKLGVAYTKPMAQGDLRVQAGYQVANYWNALSTTSQGTDGDKTDFNYQGVFLGLKWLGNV